MTLSTKIATVFGGTGFVGRQIVRELAKLGVRVKVATRVPERAYFLRPCGVVGQIVPFACSYHEPASIAEAVQGSDFVVNCVGILYEKGKKQTFKHAHVDLPANIASACAKAGVERLVHISALGLEDSTSRYAATKRDGEKAVLSNFPAATILRPSVIFGEDDDFFNKFAEMARYLPFLPLIGGGHTKFQPVYVGDVADAVMVALTWPVVGPDNPQGRIYELGGPEVLNFKEIYERLFQYTHRPRPLVEVPYGLAKMQAFFMGILPQPPLTRDQVESLKTDSVVTDKALTFENLGITPTALASVLPLYMETYRAGGRFGEKQAA